MSARRCIFGDGLAVMRVELSHGCQARDELVQDLCVQHASSVMPVGTLRVAETYATFEPARTDADKRHAE
jgi:hypothetical protein